MKLLVTGSNGLLGQKITDACRMRKEIELIATARIEDRYQPNTGYVFEVMDITNATQVMEVMNRHRPDVVIHTAAMTNVDQCESDHAGCDAQNVEAVAHLVNACNSVGAHLVHVSTDFVFSGSTGPLDETAIPAPISYYGKSKLRGEEIVKAESSSWCIVRAILVYGVVHDMSRSNFVLWAKNNLEQGKPIKVVDDQFRTATLAEDLADGCLRAAEQKATGIYHIGGPEFMSIYEMVLMVADFWHLDKSLISPVKSAAIAQPAQRPPITGFVIEKAKRDLGYQPHTFLEGLAILQQQLKK
ncbi:MAG: SDR family oxidoreductase [Bacteroidia bacterium]|jgi:dTDP-4-dehydrorhamnose reductase